MTGGALDTQTTPTYYEPATAHADPAQHKLRVMIDEAATLRGLTIQMSMRLMALAATPDPTQQERIRSEFQSLFQQFCANMDILFGTSPPSGEMRDHVLWIRDIVRNDVARRTALEAVQSRFLALSKQLSDGHVPDFDAAREVFDTNWPIVRDKITEIIWDLWADLDAQKTDAVAQNAALKTTLQTTLSDIKQFSAAIRMIAINTAVLATRPQQSAAGFKLIAREVKQFSENIDQSTVRAKDALGGLL
ncbi:hypothetical protein [uncultured Tateyamaria sp.]|uniref:hypothetical protein n=1 Tax=uncultured Tateyamaria sp. TaxID=455651 RepID=UPI0026055BC4|nr:hypothetical protein [uncultured Tateyamaria sp.]